MMNLNWNAVDAIVKDVLLDDQRDADIVAGLADYIGDQAGTIKYLQDNGVLVVQSIMQQTAMVKTRLETHRDTIRAMIADLDDKFLVGSGDGGYTFLNLPFTKDGEQWGEQWQADLFFALAKGLDLAAFCIEDRETWTIMPGGLPYVQFVG